MTSAAQTILEYLKSARHIMTGSEIATRFGLHGSQAVREVIHEIRMEGHPICSDNRGYWYSEEEQDIQATIDSLMARGKSILAPAAAMHRRLNAQRPLVLEL